MTQIGLGAKQVPRGLEVISVESEEKNGFARLCVGPCQRGPYVFPVTTCFSQSHQTIRSLITTPSSEPDMCSPATEPALDL